MATEVKKPIIELLIVLIFSIVKTETPNESAADNKKITQKNHKKQILKGNKIF